MTVFYLSVWAILFLHGALFWFLYAFVVLLRLNDIQAKARKAGILFPQMRRVECYLGLLSDDERTKWYNIYLKHSSDIGLALSSVFLITLIAMAVRSLG